MDACLLLLYSSFSFAFNALTLLVGWQEGYWPTWVVPEKGPLNGCVYSSFSVLSEEVGWEERLRNDLFCVEWDVKP